MKERNKIMLLHKKLLISNFHNFPIFGNIKVTSQQGVYIIYDNKKNVLHVGKTNGAQNGLNQRLLNHVRNQSSFSKLFMQKNNIVLRDWGLFQFIEIENSRERALLEALTIGLLCPAHIGTGERKLIDNTQ